MTREGMNTCHGSARTNTDCHGRGTDCQGV